MDKEEEVEVQDEAFVEELVFKGYPSIELYTRDKFVNKIKGAGYDNPEILWVASEKIHGSNFSIHCTETHVRYGRRTDFLTKEIPIKEAEPKPYFTESFYDAGSYVKVIHENLWNVYNDIKAAFPEMKKFSIYGEYFGGNWPDDKVETRKAVQKGVFYCPQHEFMAFDIKISTPELNFWVDATQIATLLKDNIKSVPVYAQGTFEQIFNIEAKIDSTIPELLGLPKQENNIIEGFVLRPNKTIFFSDHTRVMLKKKNQEFQEIATKAAPKKAPKKEKEVDPAVVPYIEFLQAYLNINRVESVVSKFPDLKDRNKLKTEIINDIWEDAVKDEFKAPKGEMEKKVKLELSNQVMKLLNEYFIKH